ncbi:hypothetical protein L209DRAFT_234313 [Thermothelomyces heterothallicus CBS 203.75]
MCGELCGLRPITCQAAGRRPKYTELTNPPAAIGTVTADIRFGMRRARRQSRQGSMAFAVNRRCWKFDCSGLRLPRLAAAVNNIAQHGRSWPDLAIFYQGPGLADPRKRRHPVPHGCGYANSAERGVPPSMTPIVPFASGLTTTYLRAPER